MRIIVMFDLPMDTYYEIKAYNKFRKYLVKSGYIMMQKSIYCKLALNSTLVKKEIKKLHESKPQKGLVEVLTITEKQYSKIEYIVGEKSFKQEDSDERIVIV